MAGVPVLASDLPQMKKIIDDYSVGKYVNMDDTNEIIFTLKKLLSNDVELKNYKSNCINAAKILNWEREFETFKELL